MGLSLSLGLGLGAYRSGGGFSPASLFAASEPGGWYDPSDLTTLFQDTAGTTPVTATGQTVARINDKSGRGNHATQATAASRPIYQVDGNGKAYLLFDGTDDFLVTGTITPGIDKAQVFVGVRKLSDAAVGMVAELGVKTLAVNGSVALFTSLDAGPNYEAQTRGTVFADARGATFTAPITNVVTVTSDISADNLVLRVGGLVSASDSADQGTGNYLAYPLYIGRRAGTSLPFNGRLYGLITRFGANLSADQIAQTETWMNSKTGAY